MRIRDPKLRNMSHTLSLSVFMASKGTYFYIFICIILFICHFCFEYRNFPQVLSISVYCLFSISAIFALSININTQIIHHNKIVCKQANKLVALRYP